jgi:nitroreductase
MNTYDIIFSRKSIRRFYQETIDWEIIADILEFASNLPMLIKDIKVEFKLISNIEHNQGFNGPFAIKAPYYICLSSEKKDDYLLNAGYLMQQLSLYIETKELGTCFMGAASPGWPLKKTMKFDYVIALAFGKSKEPLYRDSFLAKRSPEKELVVYKEKVSADVRKMLEAARLAPSAYNGQPWRFVVYKNRIHVFVKKNPWFAKPLDKLKMIDMGIMLANLFIAAEELWLDVKMTKSEAVKSKSLQSNEYVMTLLIG